MRIESEYQNTNDLSFLVSAVRLCHHPWPLAHTCADKRDNVADRTTTRMAFLGIVIMFSTQLAKVALLTPFSGLSYALDSMVSYVFGPLVVDLPTALAALYVAMLVVFIPLAIQAFRRHQVA